MRAHEKIYSQTSVSLIKQIILSSPSQSCAALSRKICEQLDWRAPNGKLQTMSCRKALKKLDKSGQIKLPITHKTYAFNKRRKSYKEFLPAATSVTCSLDNLGKLAIIEITNRNSEESKIWNALIETYHPQGLKTLCGSQIRYLVHSEHYGYLSALSFSGSIYSLKERDQYIGWDDESRTENIQLVVNNSRFLISPLVCVKNLASKILSLIKARISDDWHKKYNFRPLLLETFVSPEYDGSSYKASGWVNVGMSSGRRSNDRKAKSIYLCPLDKDWQNKLSSIKPRVLGGSHQPQENWIKNEFSSVKLYDNRLKERLYKVADGFYNNTGCSIPQLCNGDSGNVTATYRFLDNKRVNMDALLKSHLEASIHRIKEHPVVLSVQDTSTLNYSTSSKWCNDLGPINNAKDSAQGLILHDTMAFTTEGVPLGLLDNQVWARDKEVGKSKDKHKKPIEDKESIKWLKSYRASSEVQKVCPNTTIVSVGDREADIYDLFYEAHTSIEQGHGAQLLVRASSGSKRKTVEHEYIWDKLNNIKSSGSYEIIIERNGSRSRAQRKATICVSFAPVTISPPIKSKHPPLKLYAIYAKETGVPPGDEPIEWMLLTTMKVSNYEDAAKCVHWYSQRWGIEEYHKILKSGCRIEDRRLGSAKKLETSLAIDMVVGWRVFFLTRQSRQTPEISCELLVEEHEWKSLHLFLQKPIPETPPSLQQATALIASLGGYMNRKGDAPPGIVVMWKGIERLGDIAWTYKAITSQDSREKVPLLE